MILEAKGLTASYGASQVLFGIDMELEKAETVCILGRNGVGKTTTLRTIMGILKPLTGTVRFDGLSLGGMPPYRTAKLGIAYVPQGRHIFPNLTTKENLLIAARAGRSAGPGWTVQKIYDLFPVLKNRENFKGGRLSGGEQQMLCIARGLMQNPKLLLMDEIFEGLAPFVIRQIMEVVHRLKESDISILVSEQSIKIATEMAGRCYILEKGQVVYHGNTGDISQKIALRYLGT